MLRSSASNNNYMSSSRLNGRTGTATPNTTKPRVPVQKRGKSAHPTQRPPISQADLTRFSWSNAVSGATNNHLAYNSTAGLKTR